MKADAFEVNFDGLVGPTHNYAGLSFGNLASEKHKLRVSHPREAALQGLAKMKFLAGLGVRQAVLPPQSRPDLATLRRLGFSGSDGDVIERAYRDAPRLLAACYSASSMWAANTATVSPSADAEDRRVHFTPANLLTQFHRSIEPPSTTQALRRIFADASKFAVHSPLPASDAFSDEGAANHLRLCTHHGSPGVEVFVCGRRAYASTGSASKFPARQTLEASAAITRVHGVPPEACVFARQNPAAIDAGAFHNDVVAVSNENVLLYHAEAFAEPAAFLDELRRKFDARCGGPLHLIEVRSEELSLAEAVETYLFNSQLVTLPDGSMALIAPAECKENPRAAAVVDRILAGDNPVRSAHFVDVRQSMRNGGGPACLRLRVVLAPDQLAALPRGVLLDDALYDQLTAWVQRHYRETLAADDLRDPKLAEESAAALASLGGILKGVVDDVRTPSDERLT